MVNVLSEMQKRNIAYSGRADIGDVPPLYAAQRAAQQAAAEEALGGSGMGGASGAGGVVPMATAGGGAVGGSADFGLPGTTGDPAVDAALASGYRNTIVSGQEGPRGAPGRDAQNPGVEEFLDDYFGFLKDPAVIGISAPFVGPIASTLGPYFGAEDIPESAPLGPIDLITYLANKIMGEGGNFDPDLSGGYGQDVLGGPIAGLAEPGTDTLGGGLSSGGRGGGGGREGGDRGPGGPGGAPGGAQGMGM